jgi:hypothetical protein
VQNLAHPIAHFVTKVLSIDGHQGPLEVEVIIRRAMNSDPGFDKAEALVPGTDRKGTPYVHAFTANLSDANKRGLESLAYWGTGPRKVKTYIINQALAQYLARYKES